MPLVRNADALGRFVAIAAKYQAYDVAYSDLSHTDGVFNVDRVERAYAVFLHAADISDESKTKKAFNDWRSFHYDGAKKLGIFFKFIDAVNDQQITEQWINKWGSQDRKAGLEHEYLCRIFILSGITAQLKLYKASVLQ